MNMKHFLKTFLLFVVIIILGVVGFVVINQFSQDNGQVNNQVQVAK
jgi:hypothetical protein